MSHHEVLASAFIDELRKIAASKDRLRVAQIRQGKRPMHVDTLLKKDKDGSLFKKADTKSGDVPSRDSKGISQTPSGKTHDGRDIAAVLPAGSAGLPIDADPSPRR